MTKKIISFLLILVLSLSCLTACGDKDTDIPDGMKLAENEYVSYKLYVPENWTVDISAGFTTAYANDKSNISLTVFTWSSEFDSMQKYCDDYYAKIASTFKEVSEPQMEHADQKLGDLDKYVLTYVYTMVSDGETYKIMQVFAANAGQIYIFTYTALEAKYSAHLEEVTAMIENFKA